MHRGLLWAVICRRGPRLRLVAITTVTVAAIAGLMAPLVDHPDEIVPGRVRIVPHAVQTPANAAAHQHEPTAENSAPTPSQLADQLATARSVALRWPTVGAALADGWTLAAPYVSHIGAHYLHFSEVDGTFDVARPEMLLYAGDAPGSAIVGLAYYVKYHKPTGFAGATDHWHQHVDVCIGPSGPVQGADAVGVCATSQVAPGRWAWMLHAWVVPDWENPAGVFSTENMRLK